MIEGSFQLQDRAFYTIYLHLGRSHSTATVFLKNPASTWIHPQKIWCLELEVPCISSHQRLGRPGNELTWQTSQKWGVPTSRDFWQSVGISDHVHAWLFNVDGSWIRCKQLYNKNELWFFSLNWKRMIKLYKGFESCIFVGKTYHIYICI